MDNLITITTGMMVQEEEVMQLAQEDQTLHVIHKDTELYVLFEEKINNWNSTPLVQ